MIDKDSYIILPAPKSTNALYRNAFGKGQRGRVKTKDYVRWIRSSGLLARTQARQKNMDLGTSKGPWAATMIVNVGRKRDIDNCLKATLDLLVSVEICPDDQWLDDLRIRRDRWWPENEHIAIRIWRILYG